MLRAQVLAKSADRLAVEKLARYFIRTFKQIQQGKAASNIKTTLGADLQALTEQQVFRFPSTFTFIFRAFASVDGIGKGLDPEYDLAKFAQPFIESLQDSSETPLAKQLRVFGTATGLRASDIDVVYVYGYGWPVYRGGPMHYANSIGLDKVLAKINHYHETTGDDFWAPSPLLVSLGPRRWCFFVSESVLLQERVGVISLVACWCH